MIRVIVAVSTNGVIGVDNTLPWTIPSDLRHFKGLTTGRTILMGRKTFESIGRPLPNRTNVVLSHSELSAKGIHPCSSLMQACNEFGRDLDIIGGESLYYEALLYADLVDEIIVTHVNTVIHSEEGDLVYFPLDALRFYDSRVIAYGRSIPGDDHDYQIVRYTLLK